MKEVKKLHSTANTGDDYIQTSDEYAARIYDWWQNGEIVKIVFETSMGYVVTLTKEMVPNLAEDVPVGKTFRIRNGGTKYMRIGENEDHKGHYLTEPPWEDMTIPAIYLDGKDKGLTTRVRDKAEVELLD